MADNPFFENGESIKEDPEKLGFNSNAPLKKGEKVEKFQKNLPGKEVRGWTKACTILGIIFSSLTMMYFLLPLFSALMGGVIAVFIVLFMVVSVVCTLGLILTVDDYRNWIGNNMMDVPNFFFNIADNITKLYPYFFVVAGPALALNIAGLVLSIVGKSKQYRYFTSYIILNSIFLTLSILFTLLYVIAGGPITTGTN